MLLYFIIKDTCRTICMYNIVMLPKLYLIYYLLLFYTSSNASSMSECVIPAELVSDSLVSY